MGIVLTRQKAIPWRKGMSRRIIREWQKHSHAKPDRKKVDACETKNKKGVLDVVAAAAVRTNNPFILPVIATSIFSGWKQSHPQHLVHSTRLIKEGILFFLQSIRHLESLLFSSHMFFDNRDGDEREYNERLRRCFQRAMPAGPNLFFC